MSPLLHDTHRCTEPLSQSVFYSTFPLPVASAIALLMLPYGHNRGIMGASTWFTPFSLSVCLLRGQTADPRGVKGLHQLHLYKQTQLAYALHPKHRQTAHIANAHSRTHTNKQHTTDCTQREKGDLCAAQIDFTQQLCTSDVAFQEPQWPLTPATE